MMHYLGMNIALCQSARPRHTPMFPFTGSRSSPGRRQPAAISSALMVSARISSVSSSFRRENSGEVFTR